MTTTEMYYQMLMYSKGGKSWEALEVAKQLMALPEDQQLCPTMMEVVERIIDGEGEHAF